MTFQTIKYYFLGLTLSLCHLTSLAQQRKIDSLNNLLRNAKHDTARLRLNYKLLEICETKDNLKYAEPVVVLADKILTKITDGKLRESILKQKAGALNSSMYYYLDTKRDSAKALEFLLKALEIRENISDGEGINQSYSNICDFYEAQGNFSKVLEFRFKQLKTFEIIDPKEGIPDCYNHIGITYASHYNYPKALEYYLKSLKASEAINDKRRVGVCLLNIADLYTTQSNYDKALDYILKDLKIWEEVGNKWAVGNCFEGIGIIYFKKSNYSKALEYQEKAKNLYFERPDSGGRRLPIIYNNIGSIYQGQLNYPKASEYFLKSLKMMKSRNDESGIAESYSSLCNFYNKLGDYKKTILYGDSVRQITKREVGFEMSILGSLAVAYSKTGKYKEAFESHVKFKTLTDSLFNGQTNKKLNDLANNFEFEKREAEQARLDAVALEHKKQQQVIIYAVAGVLLIVIIFSVLLYKRFRLTNKQKHIIEEKNKEVEEKNKDITDSIKYARRIQTSLLPTEKYIERILKDNK